MWILPLIGYAGTVLGFCFLTLAIASGLYYLSELVEEHTVIAKRLLTRLIYTIVGLQLFLWLLDGFPFGATLLGVFSHVVYLGNMRRFPFVKLSDPLFLLSCGTYANVACMHDAAVGRDSTANACFGSSCPRRPLCVVQTLLRQPVPRVPAIIILRRRRRPELHNDRILLWHLRLAGSVCTLRQLVSR